MRESLEANVRQVAPFLDPRLVSAEALGDIQRVAGLLPLAEGFQFECRLATASPRADLLPQYLPTGGGREALVALGAALPEAAREHPAWRGLARLCEGWGSSEDVLREAVADVFLEFDLEGPVPELPIPCLFSDFTQNLTGAPVERSLELLLAERFSPGLRRCLARCVEALPERATAFSVGVMFSRGMDEARLCLTGARLPEWLDYLERIGWSGDRRALVAALGELPGLADRVTLDIDVGESVGPKVGLELFLDDPPGPAQPRWERLLGHLVEQGLCVPGKAEAALAWVGHANARAQRHLWPETFLRASDELGGRGLSMFVRKLSHLKVVHRPERPLEAKVYLENLHRWVHYSQARKAYVLDGGAPGAWVD